MSSLSQFIGATTSKAGVVRLTDSVSSTSTTTAATAAAVKVAYDAANSAAATVPIGGIIMWSGTVAAANALSGWKICDGTHGTPNLTNRFIVCATTGSGDGTVPTLGPGFDANTGNLTGNYTPGNTGGETAHDLLSSEIPSHTHLIARNSYSGASQFTSTLSNTNSLSFGTANSDLNEAYNLKGVSVSSGTSYVGLSSATGDGLSHENRPPYYALAFIMRVA